MKIAISGLVGLSLLAGLAVPADAGSPPRKQRYKAYPAYKPPPTQPTSDYYERLADKLPFGSSIWWEQMMRERRGGRPG
jgi:hypothetical protein